MSQSRDLKAAEKESLEKSFAAAARAVKASIGSEEAWEHLEEFAETLGSHDQVAAIYREVLEEKLPHDLLEKVARRAVDFVEEWFGDSPETMIDLLTRIVEIDESAQWAFARLTEMFTVNSKWDQLFALYDRIIPRVSSESRKKQLLEEAANIAKDIADRPDTAVGYLISLQGLDRDNAGRAKIIERLLEKRGRFQDLISLWRGQLEYMAASDARDTMMRIAECYKEQLKDPRAALEVMQELLRDNPGYEEACGLLERILDDGAVAAPIRFEVLDSLLVNYQASDRATDAVNALLRAITFAVDGQKTNLIRRAGNALAILGRDEEAIEQYAALLRLEPSDGDAQKQLKSLATRCRRHDLRVKALQEAAEATGDEELRVSLLAGAAQIYATALEDRDKAIEIYTSVIDTPSIDSSLALSVAHSLNELLAGSADQTARLDVLEKIADLEKTTVVRRTVLLEAARLAQSLEIPARALSLWRALLDANPEDFEALSAMVNLLEQSGEWKQLSEALLHRADAPVLKEQRRSDLVHAASVLVERLKNADAAIDIWKTVFTEFGPRGDVIEALDTLLTENERFTELAEILEKSTAGEFGRIQTLYTRLGDICRLNLSMPQESLRYYKHVLTLSPENAPAIEGLKALCRVPAFAPSAISALSKAFELTDAWQELLAIADQRLDIATDPHTRVRILVDAARLYETRLGDNLKALAALGRAIVIDPADRAVQQRIVQLAEMEDAWEDAADYFGEAAEAAAEFSPVLVAALSGMQADIYENQLKKYAQALTALARVVASDPRNVDAAVRSMRLAVLTGAWKQGVVALLALAIERGQFNVQDVEILETAARTQTSWPALCAAMEEVLPGTTLRTDVRRDMELRLASWYADGAFDTTLAAQAAARAVALDDKHEPALLLLAGYQRAHRGPDLIGTLRQLHHLHRANLDPLMEAADCASEISLAYESRRALLVELYDDAARLWRQGSEATGEHSAEECVHYAITQVGALDLEFGQWEKAALFLLDGARLPFDNARARFMRRKAAAVLSQNGQIAAAIDIFKEVLARNPDDYETLENLEQLLTRENRNLELLTVRQKQLELAESSDVRIGLRLEIARLGSLIEGSDSRVALLRANLKDMPGHEPTINALFKVLINGGLFAELVAVFTEQAEVMADGENDTLRVRLWSESARVLDEKLSDARGAIVAYTKAVELRPSSTDLDALARLHTRNGDIPEAVRCLTRRLEEVGPEERVGTMIRLARAQLQIDKVEEAVHTLEMAFAEAPRNAEVRKLLLERYRILGRHEKLAAALEKAAAAVSDTNTVVAYSREASDIYFNRLGARDRAVSCLERLLSLVPEDAEALAMLPDALLAAGKLDEAQEKLETILEGYGRRRSPQRAQVHLQLANVFRAKGTLDAALEQLDLASKMDTHNMGILSRLAELAREKGDLEIADRSYRSLLLMVRRETTGEGDKSAIGPAAILFELAWIAEDRGQTDKVPELVESALEALAADDTQADTVQQKLRARGDWPLLIRVLNSRLSHLEKDRIRARVFGELADVYSGALDNPSEAMDMLLKAVESDPSAPAFHDRLGTIGSQLGRFDEYMALLDQLLEKTRRDVDALTRCEILLRLVRVNLEVRIDLETAWDLFRQAEALGVREVDVIRVGAKLAGASGNEAEQIRLLTALSNMGENENETDTRSDALFRLAEIHMGAADTFDEGLSQFIAAFEASGNAERAGRILRRAAKGAAMDERLLSIFEKVARKSEDRAMMLEFYERKADTAGAHPVEIREGAQLALELAQDDKADLLLKRVVEAGENYPDEGEAIGWAMLTLARRRLDGSDAAGAVKWLMDAAETADARDVFELGEQIANWARSENGDLTLAVRIFERLLQLRPAAREAWEPLADLYLELGNVEGFECLVEETMYALEDPGLRNLLRLKWASLLLQLEGRADDAVDVMKNILLDDPGHVRALQMLSEFYEKSGREDELMELLAERFESSLARGRIEETRGIAMEYGARLADDEERISVYRRTLFLSPDDRTLLQALLDALKGEEHVRERIEITERMLKTESGENNIRLTLEVVKAYRELGDPDAALRTLRAGYSRAPESLELRQALEADYRERADWSGLISLLKEIARGMSDLRGKVMTLGQVADICHDQLGDIDAEIHALLEIAEIIPITTDFTVRLMEAYERAGRHDEALAAATAALDSEGDIDSRIRLLLLRADVFNTLNRNAERVEDLESVAAMDSLAVGDQLEIAYLALRDQAKENGDGDAERIAVYKLHAFYTAVSRSEEIRSLMNEWTAEHPEDVEGWRILLLLETDEQNWPAVVEACKKLVVLTTGTEQVNAGIALSQACEHTDQLEIARRGLEYVFKNNIDGNSIRSELRRIYEKVGAHLELATFLVHDAKATEDTAARAELFRKAGRSYLLAMDPDTALLALGEAMALDPENIETFAITADIHISRGDLDEADGLINQAIELCKGRRTPELAILQMKKADLCRAQGNRAEELQWVEQASLSNRNDGEIAARLADLAEQVEDWEMALKALRNISLLKTECRISKAETFFRQGRIAHIQGDSKRAVLYVKKALQEEPGHEAAKDWLDKHA